VAASAEQAVDAANKYYGRHPGARSLHAKGILLKGTFTATAEAAELTSAPHMQGDELPATFRFSNGSGNPHHPDFAPDPRGLAAKFYLPDGRKTDIVSVSSPRFPTSTPEGFVALMSAQASGRTAALKLPVVMARYPELLRTLPALAPGTFRPPVSYATINYYGIHAFKWIDAQGGTRFVRYQVVPEAPVQTLSLLAARKLDPDYLQDEIRGRLASGPVTFKLEVQIAIPGDPVDNPSAGWPKSRRRVHVGTYSITGLETERETGGDVLVFDPTRVIDGIELSDDPVLRFRRDAYSVSVARRTSED
jgi:catalase